MHTKLTKRVVEAARPGPRDTIIWDTALKGFHVKVTPAGRKVYGLYYRTRDGQQRRPAIGIHGAVTCEEARAIANRWLGRVADGKDPSAERKEARKMLTVAEAADRYLAEHVEQHNKPSTRRDAKRLVATRIKPALGNTRIDKLTSARVAQWQHGLRAAPYQANRALACLSKIMSLASRTWGLRPDNPCVGIRRFPESKRERYYHDDELRRIGEALAAAEAIGRVHKGALDAIRLLALTGCRVGEILGLRWEHVDLERGTLALPGAKAGARTVTLAAAAMALLKGLVAAKNGTPPTGPVLHGPNPDKPLAFSTLVKDWYAIRAAARVPDGRLHDFRHTAGTYAAQAGANAFMVRDLLGHKTLAMTGRYVERAADPMRATADAVGSRVAAAFAGKSAEVVPLDRARA